MRALIALERKAAQRRRAMKRWLRRQGITITPFMRYDEVALRKAVRDHLTSASSRTAEPRSTTAKPASGEHHR